MEPTLYWVDDVLKFCRTLVSVINYPALQKNRDILIAGIYQQAFTYMDTSVGARPITEFMHGYDKIMPIVIYLARRCKKVTNNKIKQYVFR